MRTIGLGTSRSRPRYEALVLDTAAFLARLQLSLYGIDMVTTPRVVEEVKDLESRLGLEISFEVSRVRVEKPSRESIELAKRVAREVGVLERLSETDLEVLALALEMRNRGVRVAIATDDYSVQNAAAYAGIGFIPIKTRGIESVKRFKRRSFEASL